MTDKPKKKADRLRAKSTRELAKRGDRKYRAAIDAMIDEITQAVREHAEQSGEGG